MDTAEKSRRVLLPDLSLESQIHASALGLINAFTADLYHFIDRALCQSLGTDWQIRFNMEESEERDLNYRDPSVLLKELTRKGSSPLRKPLSSLIPQAQWKNFYSRLEELLSARNKWVHNEIPTDSRHLESLVVLIQKISWFLELPVAADCQSFLELLDPLNHAQSVEHEGQPERIQDAGVNIVGEAIMEDFLTHSYTLHLNGQIRHRGSDALLSDFRPSALALGANLVSQKPNGGRLKITSKGIIGAYFQSGWGFLAHVTPDQWFPGHLK